MNPPPSSIKPYREIMVPEWGSFIKIFMLRFHP
jgi:hypothetical protein